MSDYPHIRTSDSWSKERPFKRVYTRQLVLSPPVWDDLRVPVTSTTAQGSNPPTFSLFRNNQPPGSGPVGANAIEFNDGAQNQHVTVPHSASLDFANDYTIEFWILPDPGYTAFRTFMAKAGTFDIQIISGDRIRFAVSGYAQVDSTDSLNVGAWNHVVCRVDNSAAGNDVLNVFIDGNQQGQTGPTWGTPGTSTDPLIIGAASNGSNGQHVTLDEVRFWSRALPNPEISDLFNAGDGIYVPSDTTGLMAAYHFSEGSGVDTSDYSGNGNDGTLVNTPTWTTGYVDPVGGGTSISRGVFTYLFAPDQNEELFFAAQMPHSWAEGTEIRPHIHWAPLEAGSGNVRWGLEYTIASPFEIFAETETIYGTSTVQDPYAHQITDLDPDIDMTGRNISSMLKARVFRDAVNDTYNFEAALLEIDIHYQIDGLGSKEEFSKEDY